MENFSPPAIRTAKTQNYKTQKTKKTNHPSFTQNVEQLQGFELRQRYIYPYPFPAPSLHHHFIISQATINEKPRKITQQHFSFLFKLKFSFSFTRFMSSDHSLVGKKETETKTQKIAFCQKNWVVKRNVIKWAATEKRGKKMDRSWQLELLLVLRKLTNLQHCLAFYGCLHKTSFSHTHTLHAMISVCGCIGCSSSSPETQN